MFLNDEMKYFITFVNILFVEFYLATSQVAKVALNEYIDHYESLNYNTQHLHNQHLKAKHSSHESDKHVIFHFKSHERSFKAHLTPDTTNLPSSIIIDEQDHSNFDLSHLYTGYLQDEEDSRIAGSIIDGVFSGFISTPKEIFYLEKSWLYFVNNSIEGDSLRRKNSSEKGFEMPSFHSIVYSSLNVKQHPISKNMKKKNFVRGESLQRNFDNDEDENQDDEDDEDDNDSRINESDNNDAFKSGCGVDQGKEWMRKIQMSVLPLKSSEENIANTHQHKYSQGANEWIMGTDKQINNNKFKRIKRDTNNKKKSNLKRQCSLYLQTDSTLWQKYHSAEQDDTKVKAELTSLMATHVAGLNEIYGRTSFQYNNKGPYNNFNFVVHRIKINTSSSCDNNQEGFCQPNLDAPSFLNIHSFSNHDDYCLAFVFSYRRFSAGTIGLAWVGAPYSSGGVCERWREYSESGKSQFRSLNTGIVTLSNYNSHVPLTVSIITFAHEIGHNFGAQHDSGFECIPLKANPKDPKGNFLMFASATSGTQDNNLLFSKCSIGNITENLYSILIQNHKHNCFGLREDTFCGNKIVEINSQTNSTEECDCGFENDCEDNCCYPRISNKQDNRSCTRKPNARCSKSEGPCCNDTTCDFSSGIICRHETTCSHSSTCDSLQAKCPPSTAKPDGQSCNHNTQVCFKGECSRSICTKVAWEACYVEAPSNDKSFDRGVLCYLACQNPNTSLCISTGDKTSIEKEENVELKNMLTSLNLDDTYAIQLPSGAPCDNYRGYCDVFLKCRAVDEDGPLTQLKNILFGQQTFSQIRKWITKYPWAVVLIGVAFIIFMSLIIKLCAVHTPSSNPKLKKARKITGKIKGRGASSVATISGTHINSAYDPVGETPSILNQS